ncbi:hypothetical protein Ancab_001415 [Ancistrocladus abbreviatus]
MRFVQMHDNGLGDKELAELNQHVEDGKKETRDGVAREGQGLSEEDESRIFQDMNGGTVKSVQGQFDLQRPDEQPQGQAVCWVRFLPFRSLKVLLVENDDSTRHVVSALLRNCSYEVIAVPNGLEAWKILKDLDNRVDLILCELVMPCLSGIDLLSKIMSHKTRKNIPVIMMSSHDPIGIVFKCLSKGAVDFLVKPIRKNELKNLWQHVWRKCHSSSCSGSGSCTGTQNSTKGIEESEKDTSDEEDDARSIGLLVCNGSDQGSGIQSSWTKRAVEVESPQPMPPWDRLTDPPDGTCAQVIHPRPKASASSWVPIPAKEHIEQDTLPDSAMIGKDLQMGVPRHPDSQLEEPYSVKLELGSENPKGEWTKGGTTCKTHLTDAIASDSDTQRGSLGSEVTSSLSENSGIKNKTTENGRELLPHLELSLMRPGDADNIKTNMLEQSALRHSILSAFTKYNSGSTANQARMASVGSCSPLDKSPEAAKSESLRNLQANSEGNPPNQFSTGSGNNNDMGSTTNKSFSKSPAVTDKPAVKSTVSIVNCSHPYSAIQPLQNGPESAPQLAMPRQASAALANNVPIQVSDASQQARAQHSHDARHHQHEHIDSLQELEIFSNHDDMSLENAAIAALQCGSSNKLRKPIEVNAVNHSFNGSASGSNHGSDLHNESSNAVHAEGNMPSDNGVPGQGVAGRVSGSGNRIGVDQNWSAQREAALNKYRLKRKERCFEKRVRYQSRKKLAEQRPRVRGQFVRHV